MPRYASVSNVTRATMVAERCRIAEGIVQRILGLHLLPRLVAGQGLLLRDSTTIDTAFMTQWRRGGWSCTATAAAIALSCPPGRLPAA
jgi:hypothetical protein